MILASLRNGDWLTRERMRLVALAAIAASVAGLVFLVVTSDGLNDYQGRPLGTDFSNVYAAGKLALAGRPEAPFDPLQHHAHEKAIFGEATPFFGWHYPPFFLFVAAVLALMPSTLALALWQAVTLLLYLVSIRMILRFIPPPSELGFTRVRLASMAEVGNIRLGWGRVVGEADRVGESAKIKTPPGAAGAAPPSPEGEG